MKLKKKYEREKQNESLREERYSMVFEFEKVYKKDPVQAVQLARKFEKKFKDEFGKTSDIRKQGEAYRKYNGPGQPSESVYPYHHGRLVRNIQCPYVDAATAPLTNPIYEDILKFVRDNRLVNEWLLDLPILNSIYSIAFCSNRIIRNVKDYKIRSHNVTKQIYGLVNHLFMEYPTPDFFYKYWLANHNTRYRRNDKDDLCLEWHIDLGQGKSARKLRNMPVEVTKKMAHWFTQAPSNYSINEAFRFAFVMANDGTARVAEGLRGTRIIEDVMRDDFWQSVMRFFIQNPMLDTRHYGPIVDFIHTKKYENTDVTENPDGTFHYHPEQPNFSMHGRDPNRLLVQVEQWHARLAQHQRAQVRMGRNAYGKSVDSWKGTGIKPYIEIKNKEKDEGFIIYELTTEKELFAEGSRMNHCVGSYSYSCAHGTAAIFSLRTYCLGQAINSELTIEINKTSGAVTQARGYSNRFPTKREGEIIIRWAHKNGLKVPDYISRYFK